MSGPFYDEGRYSCRVTEQGFQEAKTGKPMLVLKVQPQAKLVLGPEGNEPQFCTQTYDRTIRLVINNESEKQMEMMLKKLRHAGFTGTSFGDLDLVGKDVECQCEYSDYEGKTYEQWDLCLPKLDQKPLEPLNTGTARKLDALFGRMLKDGATAVQEPPPQETPPAEREAWVPPPNDEVPF